MELIFKEQQGDFLVEFNRRIISRFYYYHHLQGRPIEIAYQLVCDEFLLVFNEMDDFIKMNYHILNDFIIMKVTINELRDQYNWFVWE